MYGCANRNNLSSMKKIILVILAVLLFLILIGVIWFSRQRISPAYRFGTDRATVIQQVRSLSRLETVSFQIDKVIEAGTDYDRLRQFLFGDKLLLVAHGEVTAGFDLTQMSPQDFEGTGSSITVRLPPPQIFTVSIDNGKTRVFDRDQGVLTKGELNLEAEAREQAAAAIRQGACEGGILQDAAKNAKQQLEIIFTSAGFKTVTILTPTGTCS